MEWTPQGWATTDLMAGLRGRATPTAHVALPPCRTSLVDPPLRRRYGPRATDDCLPKPDVQLHCIRRRSPDAGTAWAVTSGQSRLAEIGSDLRFVVRAGPALPLGSAFQARAHRSHPAGKRPWPLHGRRHSPQRPWSGTRCPAPRVNLLKLLDLGASPECPCCRLLIPCPGKVDTTP